MTERKEDSSTFVKKDVNELTVEYKEWLSELKKRYRESQVRAVVKVNAEMLRFYWNLGCDILEMSRSAKYGDGLLRNLSLDLQAAFPGDTGLSLSNIKAARRWYKTYYQWVAKGQQAVDFFGADGNEGLLPMPDIFANVPWGHHIFITAKAKSLQEAMFYLSQVCEHGWSRTELEYYYRENYYKSHSQALTNFDNRLPQSESNLAKEMLKSPYNFEFLQMPINYSEREFEDELIKHITDFLLPVFVMRYPNRELPTH